MKRMAAGELLLKVPMTSELGNVTPAIMVPGLWTSEEIQTAAQMVVGSMLDNAGCNCLAPKAIVLSSEWPQEILVSDSHAMQPVTVFLSHARSRWSGGMLSADGCSVDSQTMPAERMHRHEEPGTTQRSSHRNLQQEDSCCRYLRVPLAAAYLTRRAC